MNPNTLSSSLFKWDPRSAPAAAPAYTERARGLQELFEGYGAFRSYSSAKLAELGFTVNTLLNMSDEELDEMMDGLCLASRWDFLVGERNTIKTAVRAESRRLFSAGVERARPQVGGGGLWEMVARDGKRIRKNQSRRQGMTPVEVDDGVGDMDDEGGSGRGGERQREHPFVVTVPGEVARGKKNGIDYLFHLYEQCHQFLLQFQKLAKERGEKYPTKVTNQVFRYAKKVGASYINKPKMRHYVHCFALHCLDEPASDALCRDFKDRNDSIGLWRQACYDPLVAIAARQGWDIEAIFTQHPRLSVWYVPSTLRQLCHSDRINAVSATAPSSWD